MSKKHNFDEKLSQRGKAEEDLWFARRDREILDARRAAKQAKPAGSAKPPTQS